MHYTVAFKHCLETLDVQGVRKLWAHVSPHLPQPKTDEEILVALHHARTQANSLSVKDRAYSHAWLRERNFPSGLPDAMKQSAERLYPIVVKSVGIALEFQNEFMRPAVREVRGSMEDAVNDAYAEGKKDDSSFIKARMEEARHKTMTKLFGSLSK